MSTLRIAIVLGFLLWVTAGGPAGAQVLINELDVGPTDWIEIVNAGPAAVNLSGYQILVSGDNPPGAPVTNSFTFPGGTTIAPDEFIVVTEDGTLTTPAAPFGTQVLSFGGNIFWQSFNIGDGGVCTLTDGAMGLDTVNWLGASNTDPVPPASFPVSIPSLIGNVLRKLDFAAPAGVANWASDSVATPGDFNPGQQIVPEIVSSLALSGTSGFSILVTTANPPVPGGEVFNLFSATTTVPVGSGPLFGIGLDAFSQIFIATVPANPIHTFLDGSGVYFANFPNLGIIPGFHLEGVSILIETAAITRISSVETLDF